MLQYFETLTDDSGNSLLGATVQVTNFIGGGLSSIFNTNGTASPIANSTVVADITGQISFYAPDGAYTLTYSYKSTVYKTKSPVQIIDPMGFVAGTDVGAANAYAITSAAYPASLYVGLKVEIKAANANTGASTLNLNASGAQPITQPGGAALVPGTIQPNGLYRLEWDGAEWQLVGNPQTTIAKTTAETNAGVAIVNGNLAPGIVDRYGTNTVQGTTDMTNAIKAALAQQQQTGGAPVQLLAEVYAITSTCIKTQANQIPVVILGVPNMSCIVNKAAAANPTIQLIDQFTFLISGIVFAGRATFPNIAIELTSANGRTGFGKITDCVLNPNGTGIHIAGLNDLDILNCKYWPNGFGSFPGAATNDGALALPAGILADSNGLAGYNPGQNNAVYIRDFQLGECNSIANGGCGIKIDGSNNAGGPVIAQTANQDWNIIGYDSGTAQRTLWVRFSQMCDYSNVYAGGEIRFDDASTGQTLRALFGSTVVVDGTQALGGCERMTYIGCLGSSITADAANSMSTHMNCFWSAGDADASIPKRIIGGRVNAGNRTTDLIGGDGFSFGKESANIQALVTGAGTATILTAGNTVIRVSGAAAVTGAILTQPVSPTATIAACTVVVMNVGANLITFGAAGTSFVADGAAATIPAGTQKTFVYDSTTALWYHS